MCQIYLVYKELTNHWCTKTIYESRKAISQFVFCFWAKVEHATKVTGSTNIYLQEHGNLECNFMQSEAIMGFCVSWRVEAYNCD